MPAGAYVKPGYYQVPLPTGQQSHATSGAVAASSHRAGRVAAASSFSPPPGSARKAVVQEGGALAPGSHALVQQRATSPRQAWQQIVQSAPSPVGTPRWSTPPRLLQNPIKVVDGDAAVQHACKSGPTAIAATAPPQWPCAPSVEEAIASWPPSLASKHQQVRTPA